MSRLSQDLDVAEEQGAAFALECLRRRLLDTTSGEKRVELDENPPSMSETRDALKTLLDDHFPEDARFLVHLDEHRDMCNDPDMPKQSAAFRQGFMGTIADVERVTVLATYTKLPREIPATASSRTCRFPVPVPTLDVDKVIGRYPQLRWPTDVTAFDRKEKRLWATLKFRLAAKLTRMRLLRVHRNATIFNDFCEDFRAAAAGATALSVTNPVEKALRRCVELSAWGLFGLMKDDPYAVKLLLGVEDIAEKDTEEARFAEQIAEVVVVKTAPENPNILTSSLQRLLTIKQETNSSTPDQLSKVYKAGRNRLRKELGSKRSPDYLSSTPLEASYAWTLACRSAVDGDIEFLDTLAFDIKCERLEPGRFFKGQDDTKYNVRKLKKNVIYYVDEPPTHPRADIFFRTEDNEVVLIDVYGGGRNDLNDKNQTLTDWIAREQRKFRNRRVKFHGVVLAPFVNGESNTTGAVTVVRGEGALDLLGGLRQVSRWLEP